MVAVAWPGPTAYVLVLVVASWAIVAGGLEFIAAFQHGETAGLRALLIVSGLVSVMFGVVLFAHPRIGAFTLALLFGLFTLVYGIAELTSGIELRRQLPQAESGQPGKTPHRGLHRHAA